jgi:hypothetical protein
MTAKVISFGSNPDATQPELLDVARCLRVIADDIEKGVYGEVLRAGVVLRAVNLEPVVFGPGETNVAQTYMDLHAGADQLMSMKHAERG